MVGGDAESRRFTDREVALVLKKASEIEEGEATGHGGGLSRSELEEIAHEVGISADAIARAVDGLEHERRVWPSLRGGPLVRRAVRAVPGELDQEGIARLVRIIDERTDSAGAVSEAIGSVRWTGSERLRSTQVSITPQGGETTIQVVEKAAPRLRRLFHLLPPAWAAMLVVPLIEALDDAAAAGGLPYVMLAVAAAGGAALGRLGWNWMSARSDDRVKRLASALSSEAQNP